VSNQQGQVVTHLTGISACRHPDIPMTPVETGTVLLGFSKLKPVPIPRHTHDTLSWVYPYPCHALTETIPNASSLISSSASTPSSDDILVPQLSTANKAGSAVITILPFLKKISDEEFWVYLLKNWVSFKTENPPKTVSAM
jgi:hypothetical protein